MMRRLLPALVALTAAAVLGLVGTAAASAPSPSGSALALPSATSGVNAATNDGCFSCHGERGKTPPIIVDGRRVSTYVDRGIYERSLHGDLACTSCHVGFKSGTHDASQTTGWLTEAKLTACGYCHADQFAMYRGSFHGTLVFGHDDSNAPMCADCHSPHDILDTSTAAFRKSELQLCGRCHPAAESSYLDGYHGKAFYLGRLTAATCSDCHGGHKILPASNPASTISSRNIVATCAKCHPGANRNFAGFLIHVDPRSPRSSVWVWSINVLYLILITVVFTFGFVHSSLYIYRGIKDGLYSRRHSG
ncbi:MAG: hypothetical protein WBS54_13900 [Acidobacteriota bacterium]